MTSTAGKPHIGFFSLVFSLSIPFWILGAYVDLSGRIPINLPISALMLLCPMTAVIIVLWNKKGAVRSLFKRAVDAGSIHNPAWYIPALVLIPSLLLTAYGIMKTLQVPLPRPHLQIEVAALLLVLFFGAAISEEVGWTGYMTDPLQQRFGALKAALLIGTVWAAWHTIPYIQAHRSSAWILRHSLGTVALRVIIVWLYNNTHKSLFAAVLCHTTVNMSEFLFPNYGSHYDPFVFGVGLILTALLVTWLWGGKMLTQYRFAPLK
ncbi:MAG TPA: CPBP family intramembrane glutamic endopeptidase [Chitinophagaceae bacterium]